MRVPKTKISDFFDEFSIFRPRHEMQLYASYGHNFGAVGKLRISAFEWYQAHVLRIDINAIHGRLENSTSFTGSQAVFSEQFFSFTGSVGD